MEGPLALAHPLDGIRVLELANYMAGPFAGMVLADLGAEVIKIENPNGGDFSRQSAPFLDGESAGFMALNRNKKSVTLNLKATRGRAIFLDLVKTADVLIENFRPGTMADLGIDYDTLRQVNPKLIFSSASAFGQTGPYSQRAGLDLILQGMSGLMSITGEPNRPPVKVGVPIADLTTALFSAVSILAALRARDATGAGQQVDLSLFESAIALEVWETSSYFASGEVPQPLGSAHRVSAPYQAVRTSDGYITIGATSPRNWSAFCAALGLQHLEHDPQFATVSERRARYEKLAELIEEVTRTDTSEHWYRLLEEAGVPCGILNRIDQVVEDEQVKAREFVLDLPHTKLGSVRVTGSPMRLSKTPVRMDHAGPLLGEHTLEVLCGLGLAQADIADLEREGVVGAGTVTDTAPWVAPGAALLGEVHMADESSVWYSSVLDGREAQVYLDAQANVQDNCHVAGTPGHPVRIGARVSLGHNARLFGAVVEEHSLIAIGATVLPGALIGSRSIVAANATVPEGMQVPPRSLVIGTGRILRAVTDAEVARIEHGATDYVRLSREHAATQRAMGVISPSAS